jgi:integrase
LTEDSKNLATSETRTQEKAAGATKPTGADIKGKLIEFLWFLKKQGNAESTVRLRTQVLAQLTREGTNILDPESVKEVIARHQNWSNGYNKILVWSYDKFAEMLGIRWQPPNYTWIKQLPFIPLEKEIDDLIAGCGRKTATLLQLLKEAGMRIGEALSLRWIDVDIERNTIRCTPEKHGNPRMFKVSTKLISMLNLLPKNSERPFGKTQVRSCIWTFVKQRKRLAQKLQNPRLDQITFHTFRHWKATIIPPHKRHPPCQTTLRLQMPRINSSIHSAGKL